VAVVGHLFSIGVYNKKYDNTMLKKVISFVLRVFFPLGSSLKNEGYYIIEWIT
jgi:phosphomevalonate kinase